MLPYRCNLCGKEFENRRRFTTHMSRKKPCFQQSNIDLIRQEMFKISIYLGDESKKSIIKNKLILLDLMFGNLNDLDAKTVFEEYTVLQKRLADKQF